MSNVEQLEPVAWMQSDGVHISLWKDDYHTIPLYTSPPQRPVAEPHKWVGLTDKDVRQLCRMGLSARAVRETEAKLKEKNFS